MYTAHARDHIWCISFGIVFLLYPDIFVLQFPNEMNRVILLDFSVVTNFKDDNMD